jgi:hypothetical protein
MRESNFWPNRPRISKKNRGGFLSRIESIIYFYWLLACMPLGALCQTATPLPPGVPSPIGPDGKWSHEGMMFTTKAYQKEAFRLLLVEANDVAKNLHLQEKLPITEADIVEAYISPFGISYVERGIGCVDTKNYSYCVSKDDRFCYLFAKGLDTRMEDYRTKYLWSKSRLNLDGAYQLATQWLADASMDVTAMNHDLHLIIKPDDDYFRAPRGKFVPLYDVNWCKKWKRTPGIVEENHGQWEPVVSVQLFAPTKTLLQMCVEDSKYILRKPLIFTNLASLLAQTNTTAKPQISSRARQSAPSTTEPIRLAQQIASADRIVCTNFIRSEGDPKIGLTLSGKRAKQVVRAISSAKRLQVGTDSIWDWQLLFYTGTKTVAEVRFQGDVFLAENGEFMDETGELEKLYKVALDTLSTKREEEAAPR